MGTIRVVWGTATGPTEMSSYDAALAAAGVHNYNLVPVSSIVPADAAVEAVGTAPDLGPAGGRLTVVEACATVAGPDRASAALGWSLGADGGPGLFYEAHGESPDAVEDRVATGLDAGRALRDWEFDDGTIRSVTVHAEDGTYATALVLAAYGRAAPVFDAPRPDAGSEAGDGREDL